MTILVKICRFVKTSVLYIDNHQYYPFTYIYDNTIDLIDLATNQSTLGTMGGLI
jgi:hypothetical protein